MAAPSLSNSSATAADTAGSGSDGTAENAAATSRRRWSRSSGTVAGGRDPGRPTANWCKPTTAIATHTLDGVPLAQSIALFWHRERMLSPAAAELRAVFGELCERPGVRPAPYMARAQWIALEQLNTLPDSELRELLAKNGRVMSVR